LCRLCRAPAPDGGARVPEGDTIYRSARALRAVLAGHPVTGVRTTVPRLRAIGLDRLVGQRVRDVEPRGKHLLHWFDPGGLALHTHMMMTGSWHVYRPGERWRKPVHRAKLVLEVPDVLAVCFDAPVCELLTAGQVAAHPALARLGPDPLAERADLGEARRRLDARADREVGEALLDQGVLAGVGNVYRIEVLFLHRVDPFTPVHAVPPEARDALLATAARLLKENVAPGRALRRTTPSSGAGGRLHVYGRGGRPCPRCGTPISVGRQGPQARLTYWCARCQGPGRPLPGRGGSH
jgi:endonuclease VIII